MPRPSLPSRRSRPDARLDPLPGRAQRHAQIVIGLQVQPDRGRYAEVLAQAQRRIGGYGSLAVDYRADTIGWNIGVARKRIDAEAERPHEILEKNLSGWNRCKKFFAHHAFPSGSRQFQRHMRFPHPI